MKITYQVWRDGQLMGVYKTHLEAMDTFDYYKIDNARVTIVEVKETETVKDTANALNRLFGK